MTNHVIKYDHIEGRKLKTPLVWCEGKINQGSWLFQDAQHVALAAGGSVKPCTSCLKAIINNLETEL